MRTLCAAGLAALLAACASLKQYPFEQRRIAAVLPFSYTAAQKEFAPHASGLADALAGALLRTGRLRLVERARVEALFQEAQLGQTGAVDGATAAKIGKQLGAQAVVLGSLSSISDREEGRSVKFAEKTNRWVEVEVEARIVDSETGELLGTAKAVGKTSSAEKHAFGGKIGELATPDALIQQALQGMGEKLAQDIVRTVPPKK